ncbi:hypothetical protein BDF14DRAFT_1889463 [Spinellus fusiger]|nr:hypothetical protein BDF14DRAFT_1889463 [Spinellus fusiger]
MEPPLIITVVKGSLSGIGWKPQYIQHLKELVSIVHHLVSHTFSFLKYICIHELEDDHRFLSQDFINDTLF